MEIPHDEAEEDKKNILGFHQMELDDRIQKAIAKLGWIEPTVIQEKTIPLVLEGKDVLVRARTGSGKTAAFAIPTIQKILSSKGSAAEQNVAALVLGPSKELCHQIRQVFEDLSTHCGRVVKCVDLASNEVTTQKHLLSERPDIVVSTPAKILHHLKVGNVELGDSFSTLIIDEADLMFSFGFEAELKEVLSHLPAIYQAILASATLSEDVLTLKSLVLNNPVTLKLTEPDVAPTSHLTHYHISAEENDKAAILYALFKLHLIRGKSVIFVNTVDKCYKLKLFLEQFSIKSCVLNSELPAQIRCRVVNQFNMGIYDIILASDELALEQPKGVKSGRKRKSDKESGVSRGIDFQRVSNVINYDFPVDVSSYIHRAGRTARGNNKGSVLSFVNTKERPLMDEVDEHLKAEFSMEESVLRKYQFKLEEVEPFRYRAMDAYKAVTAIAIRESRLKEIKSEIFNSNKLKGFFDNNPHDLQLLRHDKPLHTVKLQPHLSDVPEYIIPNSLKGVANVATRPKKTPAGVRKSKKQKIFEKKKANPLLCAEIDYAKKQKVRIKKNK
ncbi:probable ATP-dependent RNA helicase DDX56 [Phlebotomus argentipes]|uniref:probable ATP-dependent RNA helicase DDX56 n=1 Tax=Phlebotomus argentipes TaxID=94469 RepID=UPI002892DFA6|nr:probable ATP-dependent RNA helicase DDX56 [Phlebotomus argentipes]